MPMSLPEDLVEQARREREQQALSPITSSIDRMIREGMGGIESIAKGAAEQAAPVIKLLQGGELKLPTLDDLTPQWMRDQYEPKPVQQPAAPTMRQQAPAAASGAPVAMPTASQDGQPAQPAQRPMALPTGSEGGDYGPIDNSSRAAFVRTAYPYMLEAAGGDKNLAELMLAKAISENGDVGSGGGFIGNNFSGIKGEGDAGSFEADTWEDYGNGRVNIRDRFAAYSTPQVGFRAFMQFLHDNSRYAPALARYQQTGDASQLFRDIRAAGYATDPLWADKVENIRANQVAPIVRGQADQDMQRLSLNAAPAAAPGRTAPPAPAGVSSAPAGAPPAPWETAGASDGGPMLLKENDETAPMGGGDAMLPGDGGFAPTPEYDPRAVDEGPRESRPAPILPTDPTVSDPAYTQSPTGMSYGPIQQGEVQGPPAPAQTQMDRYVPTYQAQAAQVAPTMPTPAAGAVQAGIDAAVESYNDPFYQAGPQPPRWVKIVSDAMQAFGTQSGINVARSLGVTDEEWFNVFGFPISRVDVAGFAGGMAADPTNYVGLNMADPLVTVARGAVRDFAPEAIKNVGRAVGSTLREGAESLGRGLQGVGREVAGGLMDLSPGMAPRVMDGGPGIGRAMADGAGEAATIGRGGAPVEPPRVWTTRSTADTFDPEWAPEGFLEQAGIPIAAPRRPKPGDDLFHLTSRDNLERVAREGLTPTAGDERATDILLSDGSRTVRRPAVYAADNAPILSTVDRDMAGTVEWSVLRFKRGNRGWRKDPEFATDPGSWVTRRSIPAAEIEVLTSDGWRPVTEVARTAVEPPGALSTVASPGPRGASIGTRLATDAGNALAGSMVGAIAPADTPEERLRNTALAAAGFPVAGRLMRRAGGALGTPGIGPAGRAVAETAPREPAPVFYSQLRQTLDEKMPNRASAQQIMGILKGSPVKPDEITWTGLDDWLREQRGPVTKQQVMEFLDQNAVTVEEVVKGAPSGPTRYRYFDASGQPGGVVDTEEQAQEVVRLAGGRYAPEHATDAPTRYEKYTLPGGENYRELLITRPQPSAQLPDGVEVRPVGNSWIVYSGRQALGEGIDRDEAIRNAISRGKLPGVEAPTYQSSHWDEPNVLAHVRFNERVAPDGKRVLLIEEIQSDWHQAGRKQGYNATPRELTADEKELQALNRASFQRNWTPEEAARAAQLREAGVGDSLAAWATAQSKPSVPDAPFKKTWPELAIKRMIRWAAENGFDRIAWPPGSVHAERFSLGRRIQRLALEPPTFSGSKPTLHAWDHNGQKVLGQAVNPAELPAMIGEEAAAKLQAAPRVNGMRTLEGQDLQMGGEGMKGFYDKIVPETAAKLGKKFGARVGRSEIDAGTGLGKDLSITQDEEGYFWFGRNGRREQGPFRERAWAEQGMADEVAYNPSTMQPVHSMDITPEMRESVVYKGQPQFAALPFDPASAAMGGAAGAMSEGEDGEQGDPLRTAAAFLAAGVGGGMSPGARRALQKAMDKAEALKAAGKADEAAQVVDAALRRTVPGYDPRLSREPVLPGMEPPRRVPGDAGPGVSEAPNRAPVLGDVPPSAIDQRALPGMDPVRDVQASPLDEVVQDVQIPESLNTPRLQQALTAAERRAENMRRRGIEPPSAWDWIKQAGYAGIYGPGTFTSAVVGGVQELVGGQAKEFTRAVASGRPGSYGAQLGAQVRAVPESLAGLGRVLFGSDSASTAAVSGGSQGTANLSERVVNPVGHFVARMLERPGEILTEAPDAVFRPLFTAQGMVREARAIAAEAGLRGRQAAAHADELMRAAEDLRANPDTALASDEARRIVEAGAKHADELGYKGPASGFGKKLGEWSKRDDALGVVASFLVPFPAMAERMSRGAVRSTPGLGLLPAVRRGQASKFDVIYDQAFGTAVAGGLAYWAFNGGITGSGPIDPEKRQMMADQGWQPNSVLVGNYYIPTRVFGRFQPMLDTAGEIHDALAYGKADAKPGELVADLVKRGTRIATNQVGLSGLSDLQDMLTQGFASRFPGWVARSGIRYLPYGGVMRAGANSMDPTQRKPEPWGEVGLPEAVRQQAVNAVPVLRQTLPAAQDVLGRDAQNPQQGFGALAPRVTTQKDDPVIRLFQDAGVDIGKPSDSIQVGARNIPVALKPAERRRWNTLRGEMIQQYADSYTGSPEFMALPPAQKERYLKSFLAKAADYASKMLQAEMDIEDLTQRATAGALKKASGQ